MYTIFFFFFTYFSANGNMIPDLLGETPDGKKQFYIFK